MKLFVITFAVLFAFTNAVNPKVKILDPDFLWDTVWTKQIAAQKLQSEMDQAFIDAQGAISKILGPTMQEALNSYKNHSDDVLKLYEPVHEGLEVLPDNLCRTLAVNLLQIAVGNGGSRSALCIGYYHIDTKKAVDEVVNVISDLNEDYLRLSRFVYKSFSGSNALIHGEIIKENITATYDELVARISLEPVDQEAFIARLKELDTKLGSCFVNTVDFINRLTVSANDQIDYCKQLNDLPRAARSIGIRSFVPEAEEIINNFPYYQW